MVGDGFSCDDGLYTVAGVAALLKVGVSTVYAMLRRGELSAVRIGRASRIRGRELERYVNRQRQRRTGI